MVRKFKLHTDIQERAKRGRNAYRVVSWGSGSVTKPNFTKDMLHPRFWLTWIGIFCWALIVNILPWRVLLVLGKGLGTLMYKFFASRRYVVQRNLELAFPQKSQAEREVICKEVFQNAGMAAFETGMAWYWPDWRIKRLIKIDEQFALKAKALSENKQRTIMLTCHMVTLELGARMYALAVAPGIGVYRSSDNPVMEYIQVRGRLRSNLGLVERKDTRSMVKAILKGYPIWYAPDQDYGPKHSIFVPFFGVEKTATITALHDLAKLKDVIVLPFWPSREKDGYRINILDSLDNFPSEDIEADTIRTNKIIEKMIENNIPQYLWMHRRFKTTPEGESSRYPDIS